MFIKKRPDILDDKIVKKIASLACIQLTNEEVKDFGHSFDKMMAFFDHLNQDKTLEKQQPLQDIEAWQDVSEPDPYVLGSTHLLSHSPVKEKSFFVVPKNF